MPVVYEELCGIKECECLNFLCTRSHDDERRKIIMRGENTKGSHKGDSSFVNDGLASAAGKREKKPATDPNRVFHLRVDVETDILLQAYVQYSGKTQTRAINDLVRQALNLLLDSDAEFMSTYDSLIKYDGEGNWEKERLKAFAIRLSELSPKKQEYIMSLIDLLEDKKGE